MWVKRAVSGVLTRFRILQDQEARHIAKGSCRVKEYAQGLRPLDTSAHLEWNKIFLDNRVLL
jgi:hypothetical protein